MKRSGLSQAEIGRRLGITRQAIHKTSQKIDGKVAQLLDTTAAAAKIDVHRIDPREGVLVGYSHELREQAILTFSSTHGTHVWPSRPSRCISCKLLQACRDIISDEARIRSVTLTGELTEGNPAAIARLILSAKMPDVSNASDRELR